MGDRTIPVYRPSLSGNERDYVLECLDSTWISSKGSFVKEFEARFGAFVGTNSAISVANGTCGLHLALVTLGIGPGDEVIVPSFTYVASVNAITYTGATPVFVDSLPSTWQMDPEDVERRITDRTRAIMAVHIYGHPCDMESLRRIADRKRLFLIEDCAEAIGSRVGKAHVGTLGDVGVFSFYGNKTITTGEGGMLVTNDPTIRERALHLRGQGLAAYREYWHDVVGFNYRMTNICAAIGLAQLEQIDRILERKRALAERYIDLLKCTSVSVHPEADGYFHSYWMVTILVERLDDRDVLRRSLARAGIETRPSFPPVHTMPMYSKRYQRLAIAEDLGWRGINLPSYPDLEDGDVQRICDVIIEHSQGSQATIVFDEGPTGAGSH